MGYDPEISEWGNPAGVMPSHSRLNQIGRAEGTRGSETSKYPEEKKENSIPLVVASEEGRGQTEGLRTLGVAGLQKITIDDLKNLERFTREGDSPVREVDNSEQVPEYRGTREILWEAGGTTPQA